MAGTRSEPQTQASEEKTTVTSDEGDITYVEEGDMWVQVDTRGERERRTVIGPVVKPEDHPNKPEGWEPPERSEEEVAAIKALAPKAKKE